mgnify:CR=1 FL=1
MKLFLFVQLLAVGFSLSSQVLLSPQVQAQTSSPQLTKEDFDDVLRTLLHQVGPDQQGENESYLDQIRQSFAGLNFESPSPIQNETKSIRIHIQKKPKTFEPQSLENLEFDAGTSMGFPNSAPLVGPRIYGISPELIEKDPTQKAKPAAKKPDMTAKIIESFNQLSDSNGPVAKNPPAFKPEVIEVNETDFPIFRHDEETPARLYPGSETMDQFDEVKSLVSDLKNTRKSSARISALEGMLKQFVEEEGGGESESGDRFRLGLKHPIHIPTEFNPSPLERKSPSDEDDQDLEESPETLKLQKRDKWMSDIVLRKKGIKIPMIKPLLVVESDNGEVDDELVKVLSSMAHDQEKEISESQPIKRKRNSRQDPEALVSMIQFPFEDFLTRIREEDQLSEEHPNSFSLKIPGLRQNRPIRIFDFRSKKSKSSNFSKPTNRIFQKDEKMPQILISPNTKNLMDNYFKQLNRSRLIDIKGKHLRGNEIDEFSYISSQPPKPIYTSPVTRLSPSQNPTPTFFAPQQQVRNDGLIGPKSLHKYLQNTRVEKNISELNRDEFERKFLQPYLELKRKRKSENIFKKLGRRNFV